MKEIRLYTKFKVYLENEILNEIITDNNCCTPEEFQRGEDFAKRVATHLVNVVRGMHYKKKIMNRVYGMYLNGISVEYIVSQTTLNDDEVNEIIDYMNEIYA